MSFMDISKRFRELGLPANFCHVPFSTLIFEPDGKVGSCRHKGHNFPVGNIKEESFDDIWNSKLIKQWRKEFLTGEVKICENEVKYRQCHLCPEFNHFFEEVNIAIDQKKPIMRLGANFSGKCNLNCIMCNINKGTSDIYKTNEFWEMLKKKVIPGLQEIDMLSGEPFIQTETYRLIDMASEINPKCIWCFTTNGHWELDQHKVDYLNKIRIRNMIISIDGITHETYAKIRRNGTLSVVKKTIDNLIKYNKNRKENGLNSIDLRLNFLVQKDNWHEVQQFISYANSINVRPFLTYLYEPFELSLSKLDLSKREEIIDHYLEKYSWDELKLMMRIIRPLADTLPKKKRESMLYDIFKIKTDFA